MARAELRFDPVRGFELDLDAEGDGIVVRLDAIPVRTDGLDELHAGPVGLDRLEVLFKAFATLDGEPGQLHAATVRLVEGGSLRLVAEVEDVETGDVVALEQLIPVTVAPSAPRSGAPTPPPMDEDELDWADETTMERMLGPGGTPGGREAAPKAGRAGASATPAPAQGRERGLAQLLRAIAGTESPDDDDDDDLDDDGDDGDDDEGIHDEFDTDDGPFDRPPAPSRPAAEHPDQAEARNLLDVFLRNEWLALQEGASLDALAGRLAPLLSGRMSHDRRAERMTAMLLEDPDVDELFMDDEQLSELLERW